MTSNQKYNRRLKRENPIKYKAKIIASTLRKLGHKPIIEDIINAIKDITRCEYCKLSVKVTDLSVDHKLPRSRGGSDESSNLHYICLSCNLVKGNLTEEEYLRLLKFFKDNTDLEPIIKRRLKASGFMYR